MASSTNLAQPARPRSLRRSLLGATTAALVTIGAFAITPATANAAPEDEGTVAEATFDWGVRQTFRNYIYNFTMFEGRTEMLGTATQPVAKGIYNWTGGTGIAAIDGSTADVSFGEGNGVHFQSHPMTVDGERVYALDMTFTNPRVVVTSATEGELYMDVVGYEFESMTSVGEQYVIDNALMAPMQLSAPVESDGVFTWTNAPATLTTEGAIAFGGFYPAGDPLDPVTFSLPVTAPAAPAVATSTTLTATATEITVGDSVTFNAAVSPAAEGTVTFSANGTALGAPVTVAAGAASFSTNTLVAGAQSVTAAFTPADATAFVASESAAGAVTVNAATDPGEGEGEGELPPVTAAPLTSEELDASPRGGVTSDTAAANPGDQVTLGLGELENGTLVQVFLYSDPVSLGWHAVQNGTVTVTLPANAAAGAHKLAVFDQASALIGWAPISVNAVTSGGGSGSAGNAGNGLAVTGGTDLMVPLLASGLVIALGAGLLLNRRRQTDAA